MKNYKLSDLKHECIFGTTKSKENAAGVNIPYFVPQLNKMYGNMSNTIQQNYLVTGLKIEYSNNIVVRHDDRLKQMTVVKIDGVVYEIQKYEPDDRINAFDTITVGKVNGQMDDWEDEPVNETGITIDPANEPIMVGVGKSQTVKVYIEDKLTDEYHASIVVADESIATFKTNDYTNYTMVHGVSAGQTTVTITSKDKQHTRTITIEVTA